MSIGIRSLLEREQLYTLFQPIIGTTLADAFGYEALTRGPAESALHLPAQLFAAAAEAGCLIELERACVRSAVRSFAALDIEGRLFLNIAPATLIAWSRFADWLAAELDTAALDPHTIVIEVTEHGDMPHESALARALSPVRRLGCDIAIDDLGAGSSGLKTWSEIRPEFVKVDRYFVAGIEQDPVRGEILRSVVEMGRATGCQIVAEGIENREQCNLVVELGVDYVQGFYFGRPQVVPRVEQKLSAREGAATTAIVDCAEHLARAVPGVQSTTQVAAVVEMFQRHPGWRALTVLDGARPMGLVRRDELLILLSRPLHPEIYNRKPITSVMDAGALQIDARARLEQVSRLITGQGDERRQEDFIITRAGEYLGLGRSIELLRHITEQQIQTAKHANPLTGLPGNREIQTQIVQLINRRRAFVACHLDLDHFKPFNDTYGYHCGDQVLLHVAAIISRNARPRVDFVGHIGGDDFVLLMRSQDWSIRLLSLLDDLRASLLNFVTPEHRAAGHLVAHGRDGATGRFPLLSVSIAAVEVNATPGVTPESIADELRRTKAAAKAQPGCACMLSSGSRIVELASVQRPLAIASDDTASFSALA
jgi:diguanylate cyclase (GGDEF)-like protein